MNVQQACLELKQKILTGSENARLEAQVLVAHALRRPRAWLIAHPEYEITSVEQTNLATLAAKLEAGLPLPYVIGSWEFFGLEFQLTPDVLIPRPETELLVAQALDWLRHNPGRRRAADVGCGSGCIGISLAANIPDLHILATDLSADALVVARANALRHKVMGQIEFHQADLLPDLIEQTSLDWKPLDLICANLPYIPTKTLGSLSIYRKEPTMALDGGLDGLQVIRRLFPLAAQHLGPGGLALLEIEARQGAQISALAQAAFPSAAIDILPDLASHDRLLRIFV